MSIQVVQIEDVVPVPDRSDPAWLKKFIESVQLPSALELAPVEEWFPEVAKWPVDLGFDKRYQVVWFPGDTFPNWQAVDERLTAEGFGPERRTLPPTLVYWVKPRIERLWEMYQASKGPRWIHASVDKLAFWCLSGSDLCLPCVSLRPGARELDAHYVGCGFYSSGGFLVSCE